MKCLVYFVRKQLVLLVKQLLLSCTSNEKTILYPSLTTIQSVCATRGSGKEPRIGHGAPGHQILTSQRTRIGALVHTFHSLGVTMGVSLYARVG